MIDRILLLFTALSLSSLFLFIGCSGDNDAGKSVRVPESASEDGRLADTFTKDLIPTRIVVKGTALLVDFPKEVEITDIPSSENAYIYLLQSKIIDPVDIAAAKEKAIKNPGFKKIIAEGTDRLVLLSTDIGGERYLFWINKTLGNRSFTLTNEGKGWAPRSKEHLNWALRIADSLRLDTSP